MSSPRSLLGFMLMGAILTASHSVVLAAPCGERVRGFSIWEDSDDDGNIVEKYSISRVDSISPDTRFDGILVSKTVDGNATVAMTLRRGGKSKTFKSGLSPWSKNQDFWIAEALSAEAVAEGSYDPGTVFLELKSDGQVLCSESYKILPGD